jgi:hypothetical protein
MNTTLDITIADIKLEVEVSYSQGKARAYFGNGDQEDYSTTEIDIEEIHLIEGSLFDLLDRKGVLDEIREKCEELINQRLAA